MLKVKNYGGSLIPLVILLRLFVDASAARGQTNYEPVSISTLAGLANNPGSADGTVANARFNLPEGIAFDTSGNAYVADTANHTIRKITPMGAVTTLAGLALHPDAVDGPGNTARFNHPTGVAVDGTGAVYVSDFTNNTIRKISPFGDVTTFAGCAPINCAPSAGHVDGLGNAARFSRPAGMAIDGAGNLYVSDGNGTTVRKITPAGFVTTLAGSYNNAGGLAVDSAGNVYVTENLVIDKITPAGVVTEVAGSNMQGSADGTGSAARFRQPDGLAFDSIGNLYISDISNNNIRKMTAGYVVSTLAGLALNPGSADGIGQVARFQLPRGMALDGNGNIYVCDTQNHTIRTGTRLPVQLLGAVSTKTHGPAGTFDIDLPVSGAPGVESRSSGGNHTFVLGFSNNIIGGNATVTTGSGSVAASPTFSTSKMTVNLSGVADYQTITLTLGGVTDSFGQVLPNTTLSVRMLIGDVTGNGSVNSSDVIQVKEQSGETVTSSNFRDDINASGAITTTDIALTKFNSGHSLSGAELPSPPALSRKQTKQR
ncbi:MAG: dockerin type I domain-containing protein [Chthoniobacterales bacterium]